MKPIEKDQLRQLQTICAGKFRDREERLEAISDIMGCEIKSFSELNKSQFEDLVTYFNTGKMHNNGSWAVFDKLNKQHTTILSLCHTLGWVQEENPKYVDLHRLGGWLKHRSPIKKALKEMNVKELSKVIFSLEQIVKKQFVK